MWYFQAIDYHSAAKKNEMCRLMNVTANNHPEYGNPDPERQTSTVFSHM